MTLIEIVDPNTMLPLANGEVGEIWVAGPSVTHGYWNNKELSAEIFQAQLASSDDSTASKHYLRTGDSVRQQR